MGIIDFSAIEPALGYYYQIRLSLYLLLRAKNNVSSIIQVETLDDIVIDDTNKQNLFQTKLHINSVANLTNSSPDFWKTIRVWSENIIQGNVDTQKTVFTLITTAKISEGSFLIFFKVDTKKDSKKILEEMEKVIDNSENSTNLKAYEAFNKLNTKQKTELIDSIYIIDSALHIDGVLQSIKNELIFSSTPKHLDSLIERLEGWWFGEVIKCLQGENKIGISFKDLQAKVSDITYSFEEENLPDDFADPLTINEEELDTYEEKNFIKQLKLIAIKSNLLRNAISDFRRAFEQRSKWLREELASIEEIELFEKRLLDHWNNIFMALKDDSDGFDEDMLRESGMRFYRKFYVEVCPPVRIRNKFGSEYMTRGSCHMLSDQKKIGWHPDYQNRI